MSLTRRALKAMGIDEEKIDEIISMHSETVDGLKADVAKYKADAEALPEVQKQLEKAQADLEAGKKDSYKVKYEALKEEGKGISGAPARSRGKREAPGIRVEGLRRGQRGAGRQGGHQGR